MTTKAESEWMDRVARLGCIVCRNLGLGDTPTGIHHCGTYMGGGRDHFKTIGLCHEHHQGKEGIDGKHMSKREWESKYGTEEQLMRQVREELSWLMQ
jgi:hypothetical protein